MLWQSRFTIWAIFESARQYSMRGVQIWRSGGVRSLVGPTEEIFQPLLGGFARWMGASLHSS